MSRFKFSLVCSYSWRILDDSHSRLAELMIVDETLMTVNSHPRLAPYVPQGNQEDGLTESHSSKLTQRFSACGMTKMVGKTFLILSPYISFPNGEPVVGYISK